MYYVYILSNYSRVLYTGVSGNLRVRVPRHKAKSQPGFTKRYNVTKLVYFEEFQDVRDAIARETQIKSYRRSKKIALIKSVNPGWKEIDL